MTIKQAVPLGFSREQLRKLARSVDKHRVHVREVEGKTLSYIEGWYAIAQANEIFGYSGWDREMVHFERVVERTGRDTALCGYIARVRVKVRAGTTEVIREGSGWGWASSRSSALAHDRALKAAETDATKRALSTFGPRFGLSFYDRDQNGSSHQSSRLTLFAPDGSTLAQDLSPEAFSTGLRQLIELCKHPEQIDCLTLKNSDAIARLRTLAPALRNARGTHFADLLLKLLDQGRQRIAAEQRAMDEHAEGGGYTECSTQGDDDTAEGQPQGRATKSGATESGDSSGRDARGGDRARGRVQGGDTAKSPNTAESHNTPGSTAWGGDTADGHAQRGDTAESNTPEAGGTEERNIGRAVTGDIGNGHARGGERASNQTGCGDADTSEACAGGPPHQLQPGNGAQLKATTETEQELKPDSNGTRTQTMAASSSADELARSAADASTHPKIYANGGQTAAAALPASAITTGRIDKSELLIPTDRRLRDKDHLKRVAELPCLICNRQPSHPHHLRFAQRRGLSQKVSDEYVVPLCALHHGDLHRSGSEQEWWARQQIDPLPISNELWDQHR